MCSRSYYFLQTTKKTRKSIKTTTIFNKREEYEIKQHTYESLIFLINHHHRNNNPFLLFFSQHTPSTNLCYCLDVKKSCISLIRTWLFGFLRFLFIYNQIRQNTHVVFLSCGLDCFWVLKTDSPCVCVCVFLFLLYSLFVAVFIEHNRLSRVVCSSLRIW